MKTTNYSIFNILFVDIETVGCVPNFHQLNPVQKTWWKKKIQRFSIYESSEPLSAEDYFQQRAAIYAEFGKIVCISTGYLKKLANGKTELIVKSFSHQEEKQLLESFLNLISNYEMQGIPFAMCGHNIREFDIPYICRRSIIHQFDLPKCLSLQSKKPWQVPHIIDTLELWRFGDLKHYSSLELMCSLMDIETPKSDIDGSMVHSVYWDQQELLRIKEYCERDVMAVVQLYLKLSQQNVEGFTPEANFI